MLRRVIYTTNSIESLDFQLRKVTKNRGHLPTTESAVKLLWLAICNIEDRRARDRAAEKGKPAGQRRASGRLIEGQVTTNWKQALAQLAAAYPDRINPYLQPTRIRSPNSQNARQEVQLRLHDFRTNLSQVECDSVVVAARG